MTTHELRTQVLERDKHVCQRCRCIDKKLDAHHIIARRYGGTDDIDNLISYCRKCHKIIEPSGTNWCYTNPLKRLLKPLQEIKQSFLPRYKFVSKVTTMGPDRLFIAVPKEKFEEAVPFKGKYVKVTVEEVSLDDE